VLAALAGTDDGSSVCGVLDTWLAANLPLDHALATMCAVAALGGDGVPARHLDGARTTLETLGAHALLRRFDETVGSAD
jgi:hypothetical protein